MIPNRVKTFSWTDPGNVRSTVIEQDGILLGAVPLKKVSPNITAAIGGCWVWSVRSWFYFDKMATATPDDITIVQFLNRAASQPGRWIRAGGAGDMLWQQQAVWYYDATNGHAEYPGTQALPISSMAELYRRVNGTVLTPVTLNVVGGVASLSAGEAAILDVLTAGPRQWTVHDV